MIILEEKLYTSEETASILGISPRTLYRYLKKGDIEAETKTRSGTFRFTRKQIYKYLYPDTYESILSKLKEKEGLISSSFVYLNDNEIDSYTPVKKPIDVSKLPDENENLTEDTGVEQNKSDKPDETEDDLLKDLSEEKPMIPSSFTSDSSNDNSVSDTVTSPNLNSNAAAPSKDLSGLQNQEIHPDNFSSPTPPISQNTTPIAEKIDYSSPNSDAVQKLKEERSKRDLSSELDDLQKTLSQTTDSKISQTESTPSSPGFGTQNLDPMSQNSTSVTHTQTPTPNDLPASKQTIDVGEEKWNYYVNKSKDILDLARDVANISNESGRKYAATMRGGLSLHHDIEAFNIVHFYVAQDDLESWVSELELTTSTENEANIVLIPTRDDSLFSKSYKLRGLYVVPDERLIQDLMSHNEKELAKTLL